jgi:protease secretion system membrane fusion protein
LDADIRFDAFNTYTTPVIPGVVRLVGADLMPPLPPQTSSEYFLAQIEVTQDGMKLLKEKKIRAGMPATVIVKNGERPFLSYLLKPLADRFATSFKEHE